MGFKRNYYLRVLTVGIIVLTATCLVLFGLRYQAEILLWDACMPKVLSKADMEIFTDDLFPEFARDPNLHFYSYARMRTDGEFLSESLRIHKDWIYATGRIPWSSYKYDDIRGIYFIEEKDVVSRIVYFDEELGLFTYCQVKAEFNKPEKVRWTREVLAYIGPKGISDFPDTALGRFHKNRMIDPFGFRTIWVIWDAEQSCFLSIDFETMTFRKGPKLPEARFIDMGFYWHLKIQNRYCTVEWRPDDFEPNSLSVQPEGFTLNRKYDILILDEASFVYALETDSLTIIGPLGRLPGILLVPGEEPIFDTSEMLGYFVRSIHVRPNYRGLLTGTLYKDGYTMKMALFDAKGKKLESVQNKFDDSISSESMGPLYYLARYSLENLHPLLLGYLSYFVADLYEPEAGFRSLFFLPHSFVANMSRVAKKSFIENSFAAMALLLPAILLGIFLAWRVDRDARLLGVSKRIRNGWIVVTFLFGLPAWITYRLTRPGIWMVSCGNCGKLRRPDWETCQHCKSGWDVPELEPPGWRVYDGKTTPKLADSLGGATH